METVHTLEQEGCILPSLGKTFFTYPDSYVYLDMYLLK